MATRLEIERLASELRAKRKTNIAELEAKLRDCNDCLMVMPKVTFEEQYERRQIVSYRQELEQMLKEERQAHDGAYTEAQQKLEAQ